MCQVRVGAGMRGDGRGALAPPAEHCNADAMTIWLKKPKQAKPRSGRGARAPERTTIILISRPCIFPMSLT